MTWNTPPPHWNIPLNEAFELCRDLARGNGGVLADVAGFALSQKGKLMRSKLMFAIGDALGVKTSDLVGAAAAIELVHNASLVHDDLQDGDVVRRGKPAVWVEHGPSNAITAGDMLFVLPVKAIKQIPRSDAARFQMVCSLMSSVEEMARGQAEEEALLKTWLANPQEAWSTYSACCAQKTGELFSASATLVALTSGLGEAATAALAKPFRQLGIAFQIQDDLVDLWGHKGRERRGNDLREGKPSALVALHMNENHDDCEWLCRVLNTERTDTLDVDVEIAIKRFEEKGTLDRALVFLTDMVEQARNETALKSRPALLAVFDAMHNAMLKPISHLYKTTQNVLERQA